MFKLKKNILGNCFEKKLNERFNLGFMIECDMYMYMYV